MSARENPFASLGALLEGQSLAKQTAETTPVGGAFITAANAQPLGANTGAPPHTRIFTIQVGPTAVMLEGPNKQSRSITLVAPDVPFSVFVGGSKGVNTFGQALPPAASYEAIVPGYQALWAISDAPGILVPVLVQVAPLLAGDREREWYWDEDQALKQDW